VHTASAVSVLDLIAEPEWDRPFFKRLAHNDTGAAAGHQGGVVIPTDLRQYLPGLIGTPTPLLPTIEAAITADLYLEDQHVAIVQTRYQLQSWGGTRSPETRITRNLGSIRDEAHADDVLILQRSLTELSRYRLILVRQETDEFTNNVAPLIGSRRFGLLDAQQSPLTEDALGQAREEERTREQAPFQLFEQDPRTTESRVTRIARSQAFRDSVRSAYGNVCCVCGLGFTTPSGANEVQGAHIVPRHLRGVDDARNGLSLCRTHHWAFENGLFSIEDNGRIIVPPAVAMISANQAFAAFAGRNIRQPASELQPHPSALAWHRQNRMSRWL
jgi:putative restriction endonuclease